MLLVCTTIKLTDRVRITISDANYSPCLKGQLNLEGNKLNRSIQYPEISWTFFKDTNMSL